MTLKYKVIQHIFFSEGELGLKTSQPPEAILLPPIFIYIAD